MSNTRLLSGKIKKRSGVELKSDRYDYLSLADAEPDLGNPNFDGAMLISNADGQRFWTDNIRIDLTGNIAVGTISNSDGSSAIRVLDPAIFEENLIVEGFTTAPDLFTSRIDSPDSSQITFTPSVLMQSDLTVENELFVNGQIVAPKFVGDLIGNVIGDLVGNISGNITGNITGDIIGDITTSVITSLDSSAINIVPSVVMNSDLDVENDLRVTNGVYADNFFGTFFGPITGDVFTNNIASADSSAITVHNELILKSDLTVENTLFSDNITSNNITVDGDAVITGDLTVQGTTTTINSTTLVVEDKNIELAKGSTTAFAADGAGITVLGPSTPATLTYSSQDDTWNFNKTLKSDVIGDIVGNVTGDLTGRVFTTEIDSPDSSSITVTPAVVMQSDLTVENELFVNGRIVAPLFVGNIQGNVIGDISGNITGNITGDIIGNITTSIITSTDSSEITIVPAVRMNSDLTVENDLRVTNGVYAENFFGYFNGRISDISDHSIGELYDVDITTVAPQNNQGLVWDSSIGKFVPGVTSDQDLTTTSDVTFASITTNTVFTPTLTTADSSAITIVPAAVFNSDVSIENDLTVRNSITALTFTGNVIGRISDISDHSIGELYDVDITTVAPQNNQGLVWNSSLEKFVPGVTSDQDLTTTSDVTFASVTANTVLTPTLTTPDSSAITVVPAAVFNSDVSIENDLTVRNYVIAAKFIGDVEGRISDISDHSIGELYDVDITNPQDQQTLLWDAATNRFILGNILDQDLTETSDVVFNSVTAEIFTTLIDSPDSSAITIVPSVQTLSDLSVDGDMLITGDLVVQGTTTTINSTTLTVNDKNIELAKGADSAAAADGAGLTIVGPNIPATFTYSAINDSWNLNKTLYSELVGNVTGNLVGDVTGNITTQQIDSPDSSAITFVPAVRFNSDIIVENEIFGNVIGQVSDITNHSIGELSDVDIATTPPSNRQTIIWDSALGKFVPGDSFNQNDFNLAFAEKTTDDLQEGTENLYFTVQRARAVIVPEVGIGYIPETGEIYIGQDVSTNSDVTFASVNANIFTTQIDSADSSFISVIPTTIFNSDLVVENDLEVHNGIRITGDLTAANIFVTGSEISTLDSSNLNITNATIFRSDVRVEGEIFGYLIGQVSDISNHKLNDLADVNIVNPQDKQALLYDAATDSYVLGSSVGQDVTTNADVIFNTITGDIFTTRIDSTDSSEITVIPKVVFKSDIVVENEIFGYLVGRVSDISDHRLNELEDVNIVNPQDKQALLYDAATNKFVLGSVVGQDVTIGADVIFNSITGDIFTSRIDSTDSSGITVIPAVTFNSDIIVENEIFGNVIGQVSDISNHNLDELADVNIVDPQDKQALLYDAATNKFVLGSVVGQDVTTGADVVFNSITGDIFTSRIDSTDSSAITVVPAVTFNSDIIVENEIFGYLVGRVSDISDHRLNELEDVNIVNPQDKQALLYDAATNTFVMGSAVGQDVTIGSDVVFNSVTANTVTAGTLFTAVIDTSDSSQITIVPAVRTQSDLSVDGDLLITGDLTVQGTTTTINSTTLVVEDKNIELAKGAISAAAADGAGLTIVGPEIPATLLYKSSTDSWNLNKDLYADVKGTVTGNIFTNLIDSVDSSAIRVIPSLELDSDLSIGNDLSVRGGITVVETVTASKFIGDLRGDVTGNLTGDVTGDVTGNLTGDVTGNLTGDVTGDVTGNLTGNVTGQVSDITNHSIGELYDVDITTDPPTSNQTLVWSTAFGKFVPGSGINQDVTTSAEVTFLSVTTDNLFTPIIDTEDSSGLTIVPAVTMNSDLTVENELFVRNSVTADKFVGYLEGQVSDITNHGIGELDDVDIDTVKPQEKQVLIWSESQKKFVPGNSIDQDVSGSSDVTFASVTTDRLFTPLIDTVDSSEITFTPAVRMNSDLTVENELRVNNSVTAESFVGYLDGFARDIADSSFTNKTLTDDVESLDQVFFFDVSANELRRSTIADAAIRGYAGSRGEDGQFGGASFYYQFDDQTTNESLAPGELLIDDVDFSAATSLQLNNIDINGSDISSFIQTVDDSTSDVKGYVKVTNKDDYTDFVIFGIIGEHTVHTGHFHLPVSYISGKTTPFSDGADIIVSFIVHGDKGDIGYTGSKGDSSFTFGATPPENPEIGARWYDTERGLLVVYVDDGDSLQWVEMGATGFLGRTGYTGSAGNLTADIDSTTQGKILINDGVDASWMSGSMMYRNRIINGGFDVWQRGTVQTTNGYGSADRWFFGNLISTKIVSRQDFAFSQNVVEGEPNSFVRHQVTSVDNAGSSVNMVQRIESVKTLSGKTATLSFWAKADTVKNIAVEFVQNFGAGGTPSDTVNGIGSQLVQIGTSWQKYSVTVNIPSVEGKTLGTFDNDSLQVFIWFDAGSSYDSRTASLGQQSGTFDIAQVQLEEGTVASMFERRHISVEENLCYRYYWRWTSSNTFSTSPFTGSAVSTTVSQSTVNTVVPMRAAPTSVDTGGTLAVSDGPNIHEVTAVAIIGSTAAGSRYAVPVSFTVASGLTQFRPYFVRAFNDSTAYLGLNAEI